jgi:hypothetical protein
MVCWATQHLQMDTICVGCVKCRMLFTNSTQCIILRTVVHVNWIAESLLVTVVLSPFGINS